MGDWKNIDGWKHPLYRILAVQGANIARIATGLEVDWAPPGEDAATTLAGPAPAVVRLNDSPTRLMNQEAFEEAERIVTLAPLIDRTVDRIVDRDDRAFEYLVACRISLTLAEQEQDQAEMATDSLLARKIDAWLHDFRAVFNDNDHLAYEGCPAGLVNDHSYYASLDPNTQWPDAMVLITCRALPQG